jgi:hypothetical protein
MPTTDVAAALPLLPFAFPRFLQPLHFRGHTPCVSANSS